MYAELALHYDKLYAFKDYAGEAEKLKDIIHSHLGSERARLLDVACGTGRHLAFLRHWFDVEGLDLSAEMLQVARAGSPGVVFHQADMVEFALGQTFDVVTCLFGSIGYLKTMPRVRQALACMASHLRPGGLLLVEPWFSPDSWNVGSVHGLFIDEPELKIARINTSFAEGRVSYFDLHYLIGTPEGTQHLVERHELGLFSVQEMRAALGGLDLKLRYDVEGLCGRGLYVCTKTR